MVHRGFRGVYEFDEDESLFSGHIVEIEDLIYFEGVTLEELRASMVRAVDQHILVSEGVGPE